MNHRSVRFLFGGGDKDLENIEPKASKRRQNIPLLNEVLKDGLANRRPADVAQADEEDASLRVGG